MKNRLASLRLLLVCSVMVYSHLTLAAVPVEDIGQRSSEPAQPAGSVVLPSARAVAAPDLESLPEPSQPVTSDSYSQLQLLREEVMQLRGLVEQLSNEVQQLKQRQMDDYMDLDRRLSQASVSPAPSVGSPTVAAPSAAKENGSTEVQSYSNAYSLLKEGKIDDAVSAFKQHIVSYPTGSYTPNCHYWLGEVYLLKNNLEDARQSFTMVVDNYQTHRKVVDATFKLGKVYHLLGKNDKAKGLLESVAGDGSSVARKAKQYLSENF